MTIRQFQKQSAQLLALATPVFFAQIAQMSMAFVDTVVAGRAGAIQMAGVAVACAFWNPVIMFGQGILTSISPLVAQNVGAGNHQGLGRFLRQGMWMALMLSLPLMLLFFAFSLLLPMLAQIEAPLAKVSSGYLFAVLWGIPGLMLTCVFRAFLEGKSQTRPAMIAGFTGLICNIPLNIIFAFGLYGAPALGGVGCAVATAIVCWIMALVMFFFVRRSAPNAIRLEKPDFTLIRRVFRIGLPSASALFLEVGSFAVIALLITPLGSNIVAGHQVAMNMSGMVFMLPLSLGIATSILTGTFLGAKKLEEAKTLRQTSLIIGLLVAGLVSLLLYLFRIQISEFYTPDPQVIILASAIMVYTAIYQIPDCIQMVMVSVLRGYNDTRFIFFMSIISYWVLSIPLGFVLCFTSFLTPEPLGVFGFWTSIILGLICAAGMLSWRVHHLENLSPEQVTAKINR